MPTSVGPNTFGEENLVFGYDTGDTANSYRGEPAFNRATSLGNWSAARSSLTVTTEVEPLVKGASVYILERTSTSAGVLCRDADDSFGYTSNPDLDTVGDGTWKYSIWVKGHSATNTNTSFQIDVGDINGQTLTVNPSTEWTKLETDDSAGLNNGTYKFFDFNIDGALNNKVYISAVMITTGNQSHPQWLPEKSTRSDTQGLIDLTGNSTIDLTNVSFDSNAQMTFDGTDDNIYISDSLLNVDAFTVEAVINITSDGNYNKTILLVGNASDSGIWLLKHRSGLGNRLVMHGYDGVNPRVDVQSSNAVPDAENTYVAVTFNGTSYQLYINGVADGNAITDNAVAASTDNFIGKTGSTYMLGEIPALKMYNRALTASEIKANYNAIKGRFNI